MAVSLASATPPTASLTLLTGARVSTRSSVSISKQATTIPRLLHSSFLSSSSTSISFPSSLSGLSLGINFGSYEVVGVRRRGLLVRAGKKFALCQTKRSRSRKSLARTHGFRLRMRTTSGRAVLKRRRAKGRKVLCTKSHPNSGK